MRIFENENCIGFDICAQVLVSGQVVWAKAKEYWGSKSLEIENGKNNIWTVKLTFPLMGIRYSAHPKNVGLNSRIVDLSYFTKMDIGH